MSDHYLPVLGGIETHVAALAARQAARGDDVTVLTSTPGSAEGQHSDDSGPVSVRRVRGMLEGGRVDFVSYDIVHAHISVVAPFCAPLAALAANQGVPTVITVHSLWNGLGPVPGVAASLTGIRRAPVLWTAVSRVAADQLALRLPGRPEVPVVPNAVDVQAREYTPDRRIGCPVRLVSTMRIARRKRPQQLLRMFDELRQSTARPVRLRIIGDGALRARVERQIGREALKGLVTVTGRLQPVDVLRSLAESDLYVAPAVLESFGLAALEARCIGLPVVGRAGSGMGEFLHDGAEGWLCTSDDAIVDRLRILVEDDRLRDQVAEHNRTALSDMTWINALGRNDAAYTLAVAGTRAARRRVPPAVLAG